MTSSTATLPALLGGALGMALVGGSVAVSGLLVDAPLLTVQALRYAAAAVLLVAFARLTGVPVRRPRGAEWLWLGGVVLTGLVLFNLALVHGSRHAEPAVLGVAVASVPVVLGVVGPLLEGRRPSRAVLAAAGLVTVGAVLVQGAGRSDLGGLLWAVLVLVCECGFTLLAIPLLGRHGPVGVSVHATWLAAVAFGVVGLVVEGPRAALALAPAELVAGAYLAVGVTALAFVVWYRCVAVVGAARSGLLTGVAPVSAAGIGVLLTGHLPAAPVWAGVLLVAAGLVVGLRPDASESTAGTVRARPRTASTPTPVV